ncbi:hypothetical protein [Sphingorhabdus sp. SMR4y]|uniref:hypothetical protein n=1 Tax=Sphingorhabdus sp. SMR4y TaxID=2584094 RepID=UPI000B5FB744|nr:hypothetical protein [Sphingorhabdus sp. SMR4y]ASK89943.1 hypothetical protein SPHFLASMR4Y_03214 [Sphingorhabdus sp. SMR4y]
MQAKFEMNVGYDNLKKIIEQFPDDSSYWNEAQNRFQFVDRLLLECLGWEHPYLEVEVTDDAHGKADYILGSPVKAVLEAKRESRDFQFPPIKDHSKARSIRPLVDKCRVLKETCVQVIQYCALNGAQLAIVCNGPQLVVFHSAIQSRSPLDGDCFVFDGFKHYLQRFTLLWDLLSPEGVLENRAYRQLALERNMRLPSKASTNLADPYAHRYRTDFQQNLSSLASVLLEDIEGNPDIKSEFYENCYVDLAANNRHLLLSKNIIAARYRRVADDSDNPASMVASVEDGRIKINDKLASNTSKHRPIVVIGDVGVGKTSFFENLFEKLNEDDKKETCYIHINLGEGATLSENVKSFILDEIPKLLKKNYLIDINNNDLVESVYEDDFAEYDNSIEGRLKDIDAVGYEKGKIAFLKAKIDKLDQHLKASLTYIADKLGRQIMLVIDNADQRAFEIQQEAFLIAQEIASYRTALVFVALRPATFYESKLKGALSGYQNSILSISPPPADEVIKRRLQFSLNVAEGKIAPIALEGVRLNVGSIASFLRATLRSIKSNKEIRTFLTNITGGNTRLVIEMITSFFGSPNVESERIVRIEDQTGNYKVPLHEFTKHALLGEYAHFNPTSSYVACNIFDIFAGNPREHFISCLIIGYLASGLGIKDNDGFIGAKSIIAEMSRLGFDEESTRKSLQNLAVKRLIETPHAHYREIPVVSSVLPDEYFFRATSIGTYHTRFWAGSFSFIDAVSIDTPIFDEAIRKIVFEDINSLVIVDRYNRATAFKSYLETVWQEAAFDVNYYDFISVLDSQRHSFASVERALGR